MSRPAGSLLAALVVIATGCLVAPALAADHTDLEAGFPLTIEDAYPVKRGALDAQGYVRYDRVRSDPQGSSRFSIVPSVEYGIFDNAQVSIEVPYRVGNATETSQGDVRIRGLYNFNNEDLVVPAVSIGLSVEQPFGADSGGTESGVTLLLTKSLGDWLGDRTGPLGYVPRRVHVNATWFHNYDTQAGANPERRNRYSVVAGYSQPLANDWVGVLDVVRETDRSPGVVTNLAEAGLRYALTPQTVLSVGVGVGFGDSSERYRATLAIQHSLSFPYLH